MLRSLSTPLVSRASYHPSGRTGARKQRQAAWKIRLTGGFHRLGQSLWSEPAKPAVAPPWRADVRISRNCGQPISRPHRHHNMPERCWRSLLSLFSGSQCGRIAFESGNTSVAADARGSSSARRGRRRYLSLRNHARSRAKVSLICHRWSAFARCNTRYGATGLAAEIET